MFKCECIYKYIYTLYSCSSVQHQLGLLIDLSLGYAIGSSLSVLELVARNNCKVGRHI